MRTREINSFSGKKFILSLSTSAVNLPCFELTIPALFKSFLIQHVRTKTHTCSKSSEVFDMLSYPFSTNAMQCLSKFEKMAKVLIFKCHIIFFIQLLNVLILLQNLKPFNDYIIIFYRH